MTNDWPKRRSDLNHGRLGNQFRTALGNAVNVLNGKVRWPGDRHGLMSECVNEWKAISTGASTLLEDFEREMSPKRCFEIPPLCNCDSETKSWLPQLIHELWLSRLPVKTWVTDAQSALRGADSACKEMNALLPQTTFTDRHAVETLAARAVAFQEACDNLVERISKLPHTILL